jgi:hypothetical protein
MAGSSAKPIRRPLSFRLLLVALRRTHKPSCPANENTRNFRKCAISGNQALALPSLALSATEASVVSKRKVNVS